MAFREPVGIVFGVFKINAVENTSTVAIGDVFLQSFDSQTKNNLAAGQAYGDFDVMNIQPIGSPVIDPDGVDTFMPMVMSPLGLED